MEDNHYKEARKRVKKVKSFYANFASWVIFSIFFVVLNLVTSPGFFWAIFPIMGWGIGVAFQAIEVFGFPGVGRHWEEKMIQKEMERMKEMEAAKNWYRYQRTLKDRGMLESGEEMPESFEPEDEMELKEFRELRKEWKDSDFV